MQELWHFFSNLHFGYLESYSLCVLCVWRAAALARSYRFFCQPIRNWGIKLTSVSFKLSVTHTSILSHIHNYTLSIHTCTRSILGCVMSIVVYMQYYNSVCKTKNEFCPRGPLIVHYWQRDNHISLHNNMHIPPFTNVLRWALWHPEATHWEEDMQCQAGPKQRRRTSRLKQAAHLQNTSQCIPDDQKTRRKTALD